MTPGTLVGFAVHQSKHKQSKPREYHKKFWNSDRNRTLIELTENQISDIAIAINLKTTVLAVRTQRSRLRYSGVKIEAKPKATVRYREELGVFGSMMKEILSRCITTVPEIAKEAGISSSSIYYAMRNMSGMRQTTLNWLFEALALSDEEKELLLNAIRIDEWKRKQERTTGTRSNTRTGNKSTVNEIPNYAD